MRTGPAIRALSSTFAVLLVLSACGGDDEPTGSDDETTASQPVETPESTPAETPDTEPTEAGPTEHSFPEAGVTVIEPPSANEAEAAALATYVSFLREWRLSLREVRLSDALATLAVAPVIATVQDSLEYQEENGIRYSGEMSVTPTVEDSSDRLVVLGGCMDAAALTIVDDGEERPIDGVDTNPEMPIQVTIGNDGSGWKVNENTVIEDESC